MSQRPPRNFRRRRADSGSSSGSDSDPGPGPDSGLGGRAPERALGAPRNRGRTLVWATSRRAGTPSSGPAPPGHPQGGEEASTPESCSSSPEGRGGSPETLLAPPHEDEDPEAWGLLGSSCDLGSSGEEASSCSPQAQDDRSESNAYPTQAHALQRRWRQGPKEQEDYLPLDEGPRDHVFDFKGSSDTDSEDGLALEGVGIPPRRLQGPSRAASGSEGSSEGEAQDMWEAQQMRKALRAPDTAPVPEPGLTHVQNHHPLKRTLDWPLAFPPVNLEIIKKQLSCRLTSLEGVHRSHQREYERYLQDMDSAKNAIADLEKAPDPTPSHAFYRGMKAYLATLVDCLSEKILAIQELESALHTLRQEHATLVLKRRQTELQKEAACLQRLAARKMDEAPAPSNLAEDVEAQKLLEETAAHRIQRRQARESSGTSEHQEGMSSDDDNEGADVQARQGPGPEHSWREEAILQSRHNVFEDVTEEFSDIQKILLRFQQWRERFPDSYYNAYASLCLPKLFSPFIRIQMLDWNPLKLDCVSLQHMPWFQSLEEFVNKGETTQKEDSPDREILPAALDKTVLPHITGFVRFLWDPLSTSQTSSLVERCREVMGLHTVTQDRCNTTQELMDSVISRLKKAVEEDVFIPLYPKRVVEDKASPHSRFQERRFWSAMKLLGNILLWDGLVPEDALRELALDKLLNRYLLIGLSNAHPGPGMAEKYRRVVDKLPESWLRGHCEESPDPQLVGLMQALGRAAQQLWDIKLGSEAREMVLLMGKMKAPRQASALAERNQLDPARSGGS
ncbi:intron Large complex component GCFC2 isoform X2 [Macrotis lagotis]|uniref:intron Large complex component GCFC2 isoform X2 n=1 Tax=Macrotis lagotis TaxID=92651 RepID=UPI003D69E956